MILLAVSHSLVGTKPAFQFDDNGAHRDIQRIRKQFRSDHFSSLAVGLRLWIVQLYLSPCIARNLRLVVATIFTPIDGRHPLM